MLKQIIAGTLLFGGLIWPASTMSHGLEPSVSKLITAHRGSSIHAPENTLASVRQAIKYGAGMIEVDVQLTKDGKIVLHHDQTLSRTTGFYGKISGTTYRRLKRLDAGSWFSRKFRGERIPTLQSVIRTVKGKASLNIELKTNGNHVKLADRVAALLRKEQFIADCVVTSFDHTAMRRMKKHHPSIRTGWIIDSSNQLKKSLFKQKFDVISVKSSFVTKDLVRRAHQHGKQVYVWTVDDTAEMGRMLLLDVDSIITNDPRKLRNLLRS